MATILEFQDGEVISIESIRKKLQSPKTTVGGYPYILVDKVFVLPPGKTAECKYSINSMGESTSCKEQTMNHQILLSAMTRRTIN